MVRYIDSKRERELGGERYKQREREINREEKRRERERGKGRKRENIKKEYNEKVKILRLNKLSKLTFISEKLFLVLIT